ncbi:MAG: DUF951 domain-containing protein [Clostridiales bacterium]|nr:DUF951 domain-containing protein [Clostridiales bacterium]
MLDYFGLNDHVVLKKKHACGGNEWVIVRVGCDIKIKCVQCNRIIMLDRQDFLKSAKKLIKTEHEKE